MIALTDLQRETHTSPQSQTSASPSVKSCCKWTPGVETLISFHFSLLPFFESKKDSDAFLSICSKSAPDPQRRVAENEEERFENLDTIFVKTIFPFIDRRIAEEGIWRKSGNFSRIKRLQRELTILTDGGAKAQESEEAEKRQASVTNARSASSVSSLTSSRCLSSSTHSLDEIDDCDYSVHDMTVVVKRILIPEFLQEPSICAFLALIDLLSTRVPASLMSCADEAVILTHFKDQHSRLFSNFVSCLSLFLLYHQKLNHLMFEKEESDQRTINLMAIFASFMHLMAFTVENCQSNKMVASNVATLLLPLLYPSSTEEMVSASPIDGGFKASSNRHHFMLSFVVQFWKQISSASALPNTFVTDFEKLVAKTSKRKSYESDDELDGEADDENEVMATCVRFAVSTGNPYTQTEGIGETELELARLYAHVHASQDKKMIKKLNRAGISIPASAKKTKPNSQPLQEDNSSKTPAKTPSRSKISALKSIFSSVKKKPSIKNTAVAESSPSSYDLLADCEVASTPSNSFEVLRFN